MKAVVAAAYILAAVSLNGCGSGCPFGLISRPTFSGPLSLSVPCCGAFTSQDVAVSGSGIELDIALSSIPGQTGHLEAYLTATSCTQLFDANYAGPGSETPRCDVLVGPVTPGSVSSRRQASAGTYRVFVQAWASNDAPMLYSGDVGVWGTSCGVGPSGF